MKSRLNQSKAVDESANDKAHTLRLAIAGPRKLSASQLSCATDAFKQLTNDIFEQLVTIQQDSCETACEYSPPRVRLYSSLAIGADRIGMDRVFREQVSDHVILEYGAVLPFKIQHCKQAFYDSTRTAQQNSQDWYEFETLLANIQSDGTVIELGGNPATSDSRDLAYYHCSEVLCQQVDILVVVTKQSHSKVPSHHRAGTLATIQQAHQLRKKVIEIRLSDNEALAGIYMLEQKPNDAKSIEQPWQRQCCADLLKRLADER